MSIINLLPGDYLLQRSRHRANVMCLVLFGIIMTAVLGAKLVSAQSESRTVQVLDRINAEYGEAAKLVTEVRELEARKAELVRKAQRSAQLIERLPRSYILASVRQALPEQACLTSFNLETKQVIRKVEVDPKTIKKNAKAKADAEPAEVVVAVQVSGLAPTDVDVARLIAGLARHPMTRSVDLVFSQEKTSKEGPAMREFQVSLELDADADASKIIQSDVAGQDSKTQVAMSHGAKP